MGGQASNSKKYMKHCTRVLFKPALVAIMRQDYVGPSKGFAAKVCSGAHADYAIRSQLPGT